MHNGRLLRVVPLAAALVFLTNPARTARADNVVADDQIVQGGLCVGTDCVNGELLLGNGQVKIKGPFPSMRFEDTDSGHTWDVFGGGGALVMAEVATFTQPFTLTSGAPNGALWIAGDGKMGVGTTSPSQPLHVRRDQNANTFLLVQNAVNAPSANAVVRTQADVAVQNFQSHASGRTLVRWGTPLGGWNEFLSVVGTGLAMGTLGSAPMILGTNSTGRMRLDEDSNVIDFAGGGQYNGANFLDASSRERKQDIRPLEGEVAMEALAGLAPVTFAYRDAPGDPRVGFVAEEVPALVARPGRTTLSALEIVAVLTKVVQEQQQVVQGQQKTITDLTASLAELTARITALETRP